MQHPNEYIRGNTLRFLCKLREAELIEPLLSSARQCLEHRHAYVRKNAVFAVSSIYTHSASLIPDASELIATFLESENDPTCKRNAFAALASIDHEKALLYLSTVFEGIPNAEELLQLVELEFIRKDAVQNSQNKVTRTKNGHYLVAHLTLTRHGISDSFSISSKPTPRPSYTKPLPH